MSGLSVGPSAIARPAAGRRQRPIVGERRLEAPILRLRRLEPGDEGGDVLGAGRVPDHLGRIDLPRVDEQLGVDLMRLEPARSEIGGDLQQADAEAQLELGALVGRARREQPGDDRGVVVLGVEAVLIGVRSTPASASARSLGPSASSQSGAIWRS